MNERKRRRPVVQTHRARPTSTQRPENEGENDIDEETMREMKEKYVEFICTLLLRMDIKALQRMMEAALKETE